MPITKMKTLWMKACAAGLLHAASLHSCTDYVQTCGRACVSKMSLASMLSFFRGQTGTNCSLCYRPGVLCPAPSANSAFPLWWSWYGPKYQVFCSVNVESFNQQKLIFTYLLLCVCVRERFKKLIYLSGSALRRSRHTGMHQHQCLCFGFPLQWLNTKLNPPEIRVNKCVSSNVTLECCAVMYCV